MVRTILAIVGLLVLSTTVLAQQSDTTTMVGYIIDNLCAGSQTSAQLDEFVKTHTKSCALAPDCMASGYAIYADHKLQKFDQKSSEMIAAFLQKPDSRLVVEVVVKQAGDKLSLVSIKNG